MVAVVAVFGFFWLNRKAEFKSVILDEGAVSTDEYKIDFSVENVGSKAGATRCVALAFAGDNPVADLADKYPYDASYSGLSESNNHAAVDLHLEVGEMREISFLIHIFDPEGELDYEAADIHSSRVTCVDQDPDGQ